MSRVRLDRNDMDGQGRLGNVGASWCRSEGGACHIKAGTSRRGFVRYRYARLGASSQTGLGLAPTGVTRSGSERHGRHGEDRTSRRRRTRHGEARQAGRDCARFDPHRFGSEWQARHVLVSHVTACHGADTAGGAPQGLARPHPSRQAWPVTAPHHIGGALPGKAGVGWCGRPRKSKAAQARTRRGPDRHARHFMAHHGRRGWAFLRQDRPVTSRQAWHGNGWQGPVRRDLGRHVTARHRSPRRLGAWHGRPAGAARVWARLYAAPHDCARQA